LVRTAFITGANGFLGLNLIEELSKHEWKIIAFHLPGTDLKYLSRFDVITKAGDLNDSHSLADALPDEVDAVFHVAGNTSMWSKNAQQQYQDNVVGTQSMVNVAFQKRAKKFIYTSSIAAYGYHKEPVNEKTISNALDCGMNYNKTKYLAEQIVKGAVYQGLPAVILNPINIIGPYDMNNWTKQFVKPVYYDRLAAIPPGRAMWCHVKDIVDAHIQAVDYGCIGENYLLGGVEASFLDVVNEIERQLGKKISTRVQSKTILKLLSILLMIKSEVDGKEPVLTPAKYKRAIGSITCDYSKAIRTLNYHTSPLEEMIKDSYDWLRKEDLL
jgi:dihydroflavonol-4-reductase